jgi:hypothetical protein
MMFSETTNYSITNENNQRSTITLPKFTADVLQIHIPNVHNWIQYIYDSVLGKMPHKTRRYRGNIVRLLSEREAQKHPMYYELIDKYL